MMSSQLVIFDIDGTLTATNEVDDECYCRALAGALRLTPREIEWTEAPHVTDSGIAHWLWMRHRHRAPTTQELSAVKKQFLLLLETELTAAPDRFAPIEGASEAIDGLRTDGWAVAFATGGWGESAVLKLRAAGIAHSNMSLACADDAQSREEIVQLAQHRSEALSGGRFNRAVSVGDAPWDVRTAQRLRLPFVGVGRGQRADRLRAAGACQLVEHLVYSSLREALLLATVPL